MPGKFIDTNVILYLASSDAKKADQAERVLAAGGTISVQVLSEITNVARRKMHMSWADTTTFLTTIRSLLSVEPLTIETHETSIALAQKYSLSVYDAMIAASALSADCDTLLSEDMQTGAVLDGRLHIVNPFQQAVEPPTSTRRRRR